MNIILSIHPKWARLIYEGKKIIEWRKSFPKIDDPTIVFIYETAPIKKITGFFVTSESFIQIIDPIKNDIGVILRRCVNREDLAKYKGKSKHLYGWEIYEPHKFRFPLTIDDIRDVNRPPQSWCYTGAEATWQLIFS